MSSREYYTFSLKEIENKFKTSCLSGLSKNEIKERLGEYGKNQLNKKQNWRWFKLALNQFNDALVWILLVAAGLAFVFGEYRDVIIILIIVGINSIIGFLQEFKAEKILDSIKKLTTDQTQVIRDGKKQEVDARLIVPGDVVFVVAGDRVPADGYIVESYDFKVNSFIFTGESAPESKSAKILEGKNIPLADIDNMLFMGETVIRGEGKFIVTGTGANTQLGKIAHLTGEMQETMTPMQKQMRLLGRLVTIFALLIGLAIMIVGHYLGMSLYHNFIFALALSVSVVPEGLPAAISVALSLGMKRLLRHNVLAKKLNAVETLGSVSIICSDKTGTITKNELTVTNLVINNQSVDVSGVGYSSEGHFSLDNKVVNPSSIKNLELLFRIGTLCNDASLVIKEGVRTVVGDPTEGAIIVAGEKFNPKENYYEIGETKITENPFSSDRMRMSVVYKNAQTLSMVKGSPDVMIDLCDFIKVDDEILPFAQEDKNKIKSMYNDMSAQALRVLAFAYRNLEDVSEDKYLEEAEKSLTWVGMMAMIDPPRADVALAIEECKQLGIKVVMITGDYEITASAIAKKINLIRDEEEYEVINGKRLNELSDDEIYKKIIKKDIVFARIAPEQKLRIATILKKNNEIIAMTGDGVNDAPALKKADVGIAMGIVGTDVSKEASDMILLDDNFTSIVRGIREGRTIYGNLKKFVHYVFTSNASELLTIIFGVILQIPSPIIAVQILSIDLATDVLPSFSLSLEPAEKGMNKKIKNSSGSIMTWRRFRRIMYLGIIMAVGAISAFIWSMMRGGWKWGEAFDENSLLYIQSTAVTYAVLAMSQMANLLQSRSEKLTPFELGFFKNKFAIGSIFISFGILLAFLYLPFFQKYLRLSPIVWQDWLVVGLTTLAVYIFESVRKKRTR
ncbi:MAG TPA: ATPase [Candidatus Moranbacteria bacterium]|nr:MAG: putative cation-transporting ATPase, P-type family [Candidatus Moranbacteria bacterium GW2011_GWF1_34_10]HBI16912.1 ATPase [Candidatus Moranbacteria bacterium]